MTFWKFWALIFWCISGTKALKIALPLFCFLCGWIKWTFLSSLSLTTKLIPFISTFGLKKLLLFFQRVRKDRSVRTWSHCLPVCHNREEQEEMKRRPKLSTAKHPQGASLNSIIAMSPSTVLSALDVKFHLLFTTTIRSMYHSHFVGQEKVRNFLKGTQLMSVEPRRKPKLALLSSLCL